MRVPKQYFWQKYGFLEQILTPLTDQSRTLEAFQPKVFSIFLNFILSYTHPSLMYNYLNLKYECNTQGICLCGHTYCNRMKNSQRAYIIIVGEDYCTPFYNIYVSSYISCFYDTEMLTTLNWLLQVF